MVGLILLGILLPIAYLVLLLVILGNSNSQKQTLDGIKTILNQVRDQLYDLDERVRKMKKEEERKAWIPGARTKEEPIVTEKPAPVDDTIIIPEIEKIVPLVEKPVEEPQVTIPPPVQKEEPITEPVIITKTAEAEPEKVFVPEEKQTDWEKIIGENLANKIGIAILVLGIAFFVKFAIDKDWVHESGRVIIGLISGGILISLAHYTRNTYRSFSSVLVGGGLTVFYFTIAFAFHEYHLLSQQAAFAIMVVITAFAVVLSLLYNRMELAILAMVGGFITPFLVSTGQNNYVALFTYLSILNVGMLVLSWFKRWKVINIIALFFTVIIYGGWVFNQSVNVQGAFPYGWSMFFATLFYVLFVAMNIINNLKLKIKFGAFDFILLLSINFLYYSAGMISLQHWNNGEYQGLFTAVLGVVNLALAWIFFKREQTDKNFIYLLIGLTLTFISLAAPVQLSGNHITLFWAAESVVLFWLYQRSRIILLKIASPLVILLMFISLIMDWSQIYSRPDAIIPVLANKGFITTFVSGIALLLYYYMMRKERDEHYALGIENKFFRNFLLTSGILVIYAAGAWELFYQFKTRLPQTAIYAVYLQLYSVAYIIIMLQLFTRSASYILLKLMLSITALVLYMYSLRVSYRISLEMLTNNTHTGHFIAHWIGAALLIWLLYDLIVFFRKLKDSAKDYQVPFTLLAAVSLIFVLSVEMYYVIMWMNYSSTDDWDYWENLYYKAGLSIMWGLCSFTMMWLGMKHKFKTLRIISLSLFTITIGKLFLYDIQNIPPGGKIAAFILLGVLLLIVSFMYQRLKKIIIDDKEKS